MRDYHVHLGFGNHRVENRANKFEDEHLNNAYNNLLEYKGKGFTYLRDGGDRDMIAFQLKGEAKKLGIRLDSPGRAITKANCYGKDLGRGVTDFEDLKAELDFLLKTRVDLIKVILTGLVNCTKDSRDIHVFFDRRERYYIRDFCRETGLPMMVHVNSKEGVLAAIDMGATTIEHGYFADEYCMRQMKEQGTIWIPTVAPFGNAVYYDRWPIKSWDKELVTRLHKGHMKAVTTGYRIGVHILPGSDSGTSIVLHGQGSFDEARFLKVAKENR